MFSLTNAEYFFTYLRHPETEPWRAKFFYPETADATSTAPWIRCPRTQTPRSSTRIRQVLLEDAKFRTPKVKADSMAWTRQDLRNGKIDPVGPDEIGMTTRT